MADPTKLGPFELTTDKMVGPVARAPNDPLYMDTPLHFNVYRPRYSGHRRLLLSDHHLVKWPRGPASTVFRRHRQQPMCALPGSPAPVRVARIRGRRFLELTDLERRPAAVDCWLGLDTEAGRGPRPAPTIITSTPRTSARPATRRAVSRPARWPPTRVFPPCRRWPARGRVRVPRARVALLRRHGPNRIVRQRRNDVQDHHRPACDVHQQQVDESPELVGQDDGAHPLRLRRLVPGSSDERHANRVRRPELHVLLGQPRHCRAQLVDVYALVSGARPLCSSDAIPPANARAADHQFPRRPALLPALAALAAADCATSGRGGAPSEGGTAGTGIAGSMAGTTGSVVAGNAGSVGSAGFGGSAGGGGNAGGTGGTGPGQAGSGPSVGGAGSAGRNGDGGGQAAGTSGTGGGTTASSCVGKTVPTADPTVMGPFQTATDKNVGPLTGYTPDPIHGDMQSHFNVYRPKDLTTGGYCFPIVILVERPRRSAGAVAARMRAQQLRPLRDGHAAVRLARVRGRRRPEADDLQRRPTPFRRGTRLGPQASRRSLEPLLSSPRYRAHWRRRPFRGRLGHLEALPGFRTSRRYQVSPVHRRTR